MSITRINDFRAMPDAADSLRDFLTSIMPPIASSTGCQSCQLLQSKDELGHFLLVEVWDSIDAHQESLKNSPHGMFKKISHTLAEPPRGEYYTSG